MTSNYAQQDLTRNQTQDKIDQCYSDIHAYKYLHTHACTYTTARAHQRSDSLPGWTRCQAPGTQQTPGYPEHTHVLVGGGGRVEGVSTQQV